LISYPSFFGEGNPATPSPLSVTFRLQLLHDPRVLASGDRYQLSLLGILFLVTAPLRYTPLSGGLVLMAIGIAAAAWLIHEHVRDTDLPHGIGGSSLQLALFFPIAIYGIPLLLIATLFLLFASYKGAPAWFVDQ
jgi:hypothetical protein